MNPTISYFKRKNNNTNKNRNVSREIWKKNLLDKLLDINKEQSTETTYKPKPNVTPEVRPQTTCYTRKLDDSGTGVSKTPEAGVSSKWAGGRDEN